MTPPLALSPAFFDGLVVAVIVIGILFALRRVRADVKRGARWKEDQGMWYDLPPKQEDQNQS